MATAMRSLGGNDDSLAEALARIALAAGATILSLASTGIVSRRKADGSDVTNADAAAEEEILRGLRKIAPDTPVLAEESFAPSAWGAENPEFFLVDPLDGTREFLAGRDEYTVNIALVRAGAPVAGAVYAPAQGRLWFAAASAWEADVAGGDALPDRARWRPIHTRPAQESNLVALLSRSHLDARADALLDAVGPCQRVRIGSSLKFCLLAQGDGDIYPRFGPTMEWDTAAGDAVLRAAGGIVLDDSGRRKRYGRAEAGFRNGGFVALADPAMSDKVTNALAFAAERGDET